MATRSTWPPVAVGAAIISCVASCDSGEKPQLAPLADSGPTVSITAQTVESGFALGVLRKSVDLKSFSIGRLPVTVGDYRKCVAAGTCLVPATDACNDWPGEPITWRPNYHESGVAEDVAVTCVGVEAARRYCAWSGGRLPTLEEWLLAARGAGPQRYPWGASSPSCEQHGLARPTEGKPCSGEAKDLGRVGLHGAGASVFGLQDVLLSTGELIDPSADSLFPACQTPTGQTSASARPACVVYGSAPGSIDSAFALAAEGDRGKTSHVAYGFRCVWEGGS